MNGKQYMLFITDKKGVVLHQQMVAFETIGAYNDWFYTFCKTDKYATFAHLIANTCCIEMAADSKWMEHPEVRALIIYNCNKCEFTNAETRVALEMEDGKSVKLGSINLNISTKTLEGHITNMNRKSQKGSLKLTINFLKIPLQDE